MATSKNYGKKKVRITSGIFWTPMGKNLIMEKSDAGAACLSWTCFFYNSVGYHICYMHSITVQVPVELPGLEAAAVPWRRREPRWGPTSSWALSRPSSGNLLAGWSSPIPLKNMRVVLGWLFQVFHTYYLGKGSPWPAPAISTYGIHLI